MFLPAREDIGISTTISITGTIFSYMTGQFDKSIEALLIMMVLDYLSGITAACISPNQGLDSRIGLRGICKKVMILLMVAAAHFVDYAVGQEQELVRTMVIYFFIGNEGLSILENAASAGLPIPQKLKMRFKQLSQKEKEK